MSDLHVAVVCLNFHDEFHFCSVYLDGKVW